MVKMILNLLRSRIDRMTINGADELELGIIECISCGKRLIVVQRNWYSLHKFSCTCGETNYSTVTCDGVFEYKIAKDGIIDDGLFIADDSLVPSNLPLVERIMIAIFGFSLRLPWG